MPIPSATGFILTSPHRNPRVNTDRDSTYSILPFSKQALLVNVLGVMGHDGLPSFQPRGSPVLHLEIDLFHPNATGTHQERHPKRAGSRLGAIIDEYRSGAETPLTNSLAQDLAPLVMFRQLRYLKIEGMTQNYQVKIWQCVWLNPHLHTVILGMSCNGEKIRAEEIRAARLFAGHYSGMHAACKGRGHSDMPAKISLARLSLANFVLDAEPFEWFDGSTLAHLELIECLDQGLTLRGDEWKNTRITGIIGHMQADLTSRYIFPSSQVIVTIE